MRNSDKEVWYNTPSNKKKMLNVPYGEEPSHMVASFFQSDEGIESLKHLSGLAKNVISKVNNSLQKGIQNGCLFFWLSLFFINI